jgi:hypothetical protein
LVGAGIGSFVGAGSDGRGVGDEVGVSLVDTNEQSSPKYSLPEVSIEGQLRPLDKAGKVPQRRFKDLHPKQSTQRIYS